MREPLSIIYIGFVDRHRKRGVCLACVHASDVETQIDQAMKHP